MAADHPNQPDSKLDTPPSVADEGPIQRFTFHIGKCHLDASASYFMGKGRPDLRIYERIGTRKETLLWSARDNTGITTTGTDAAINVDASITAHLAGSVRIELADVGKVWNTTAVEIIVPAEKLRSQLVSGKIRNGRSWADVAIVDSPGLYRIRLDRTIVGGDDFEALGGSVANISPRDRGFTDWAFSPARSATEKISELKRQVGDSWGQCDHRILVYQNGKTIFDTAARPCVAPQGLLGIWANCEFDIDWRPGDALTVTFEDWRSLLRDRVIFTKECKSEASIEILSGMVQGGLSEKSAVLLQATSVR